MSFVNESTLDRVVRVLLGVALLALGWTGYVQGIVGIILIIIGFISLLTGLVGFCPIYYLLKLRTNKV